MTVIAKIKMLGSASTKISGGGGKKCVIGKASAHSRWHFGKPLREHEIPRPLDRSGYCAGHFL